MSAVICFWRSVVKTGGTRRRFSIFLCRFRKWWNIKSCLLKHDKSIYCKRFTCSNREILSKYTVAIFFLHFPSLKLHYLYLFTCIPVCMWQAVGILPLLVHYPINPQRGHAESKNSHQQNKSPALSALWWKASLHWEIVQFSKQTKDVNAVISAAGGLISIYRFK